MRTRIRAVANEIHQLLIVEHNFYLIALFARDPTLLLFDQGVVVRGEW
jgi:hypothetical protein